MANLKTRIDKLEQAKPNIPHIIVAFDGKGADENEDDEAILERKCRERGITRQAFEASRGHFIRVQFVKPTIPVR